MSETIDVGDEVLLRGEVTQIDVTDNTFRVQYGDGDYNWHKRSSLELVRKHNQPEEATVNKWDGVKKARLNSESGPRDIWGIHSEGENTALWLSDKTKNIRGITVDADNCTPYTPPVAVGSRVRRTAGPCNTGEVVMVRHKEAVYDDGNELWLAPLDELTVID